MSMTAEQRKADLVDRVAAEARARVASGAAESVEVFVRRYFAFVAADDVIYTSFDTLLGSVLSLWELGEERKRGSANVHLFNPTVEKTGWALEHTVIEIVNDDMPFLVDSVSAEIGRRERNIHLMLHPIVRVRRDDAGKRLEMSDTQAAASDALVESYMHLEIDQETDAAELESMQASIERILHRVRLAVGDWQTMRKRMADLVAELDAGVNLPMPPEEVEEARDFLRWLDEGHFVFLGFRRYGFETRDGKDYLPPEPGSGLGILREIRPESENRGHEPLSREFSEYARKKNLLIITKANSRSTVHRSVPMDRIGVKRYDAGGNLIGEDRFLGLFTSAAYNKSIRDIPMLRLKAKRVFDRAGLDPHSHNGKALVDILETFPRDEFFQITDSDLHDITRGILLLQERQRVALFTRRDVFERFVSCFVFVPRDRYTVEFKERARALLEEAFDGRDTQVFDHVTPNSSLARGLFVVKAPPEGIPQPDLRRVEAYLAEAARTWSDRLLDALVQARGEDGGIEMHRRYKKAFPLAYQERFTAGAALYDIEHIEDVLANDRLVVDLYRHRSEQRQFHVKIIHSGAPVPLSEIMPRLENMGVRVQSEVPYEVQPAGAPHPVRIRDFSLDSEGMQDDLRPIKEKFQEAFIRVWRREAENDGYNRLVLGAELEWPEIVVLRAYAKYMRQIGINLSDAYIQQTLANNPALSRMIIQLFNTHFDPQLGPAAMQGEGPAHPELSGRQVDAASLRSQIEDALENVSNRDEDRILRLYVTLIEATLRTTYFQRDASGERKPYLSFKLDSEAIRELPLPRPKFEIFVYAPFMEGIHLRAGKVARGGIRWSDRREDFRTEVLGLMKAQNVKNVVIVPMGSKGGFVVKNASADRDTYQQEGVESYKTLLRGMLDLTDNLRGDEVIPPPDVVRRDADDPYLVVAADKGTATFSDIANAISAEYGFWLGDAFASGGSAGYDHKKMGITARGAWEAVKRHFRELGLDTQNQDFTVVGVGDMSGDVFGNAMLLSPHTRLVGAFNHSHILVDPSPDPRASYAERRRLFDMRLNWNGYNQQLLSKGGAVYARSAKSITVSAEVQKLFELPRKTITPVELIRAILRAPADLLWLGGIGTYVKASDEDHAAARDRANDALRVNANELRVRVVGEGANLGFTQKARIEFNLHGGRINNDAIDNSAGVDTSDHEVNIKILLYDAMERGELKGGIETRNRLLAAMTDEVAALVLRDNYEQTQSITITHTLGEALLDTQARFMRAQEKSGRLDRALEFLPDDETIAERHAAHLGLTRPEIAVLLAYSKIVLYQDLLASDLPDDPLLAGDLLLYFPEAPRQQFPNAIGRHRLRREIIATYVTNSVINRLRPTFVWQMTEETGRPASDVARGYTIIRDTFDLRTVWSEIEQLDNKVPAALQTEMMIGVGHLLERALRWILKTDYEKLDITAYISEFKPRIKAIEQRLDEILPPSILEPVRARETRLVEAGIPQQLADRIAALDVMTSAMDIVRISRSEAGQAAAGVEEVARVYFGVGARFGLDRLRTAGSAIAADTPWKKAAVAAVVDDLFNHQSVLASRVIGETNGSPAGTDPIDNWLAQRRRVTEQTEQTMNEVRSAPKLDLAMLTVASRQLRVLVES
ncbi:MAG TPA: NAD-glutamate dehydrogenase [Thermoanaerobaculia bacterium]|nr:NAD-glutamate dehydrogenase [Thermoanaerobaculia bacterium]